MEKLSRFFKKIFSRATQFVVGVLMYLFAALSVAQDASFPRDLTLQWTNASEYTDSTAIAAGDLTGVRLECSNNLTPTVLIVNQTVVPTGEGTVQEEIFVGVVPTAGEYTCYGWSIVADGSESGPSNASTKKVLGTPLPPFIMNITVG